MAQTKNVDPEISKQLVSWRIRARVTRLGLSRDLGVTKSTIANWEQQLNEPTVDMLVKIAEISDDEARRYFLHKAGRKTGLSTERLAEVSQAVGGRTSKKVGSTRTQSIRTMSITASAGRGWINEAEHQTGEIVVPRGLLPLYGDPVAITLAGDSMEPTIKDGTLIIVDASPVRLAQCEGKIVAAWHEVEGVKVKRLVRREGELRLASDNIGYAPIPLTKEWTISGVVRGWFQEAQ